MLFSLEAHDLSFLKIKKKLQIIGLYTKVTCKTVFPYTYKGERTKLGKNAFHQKRIPNGDITKPFRFRDDIYI